MNDLQIRIIIDILLLALIALSGIHLHRKGKPYKTGVFTLHKLAAIGAMILVWILGRYIQNNPDFEEFVIWERVLVFVFAALSFITGGLQSFEKTANKIIVVLHKITSWFLLGFMLIRLTSYF